MLRTYESSGIVLIDDVGDVQNRVFAQVNDAFVQYGFSLGVFDNLNAGAHRIGFVGFDHFANSARVETHQGFEGECGQATEQDAQELG